MTSAIKGSSKKIISCLLMLIMIMGTLTACTVKVTENNIECCGKMYRYTDGTLEVKSCKHFTCTRTNGRWRSTTGGFTFWTTDGKNNATGQLNGKVMTIIIK
jgi:hypothetical protein